MGRKTTQTVNNKHLCFVNGGQKSYRDLSGLEMKCKKAFIIKQISTKKKEKREKSKIKVNAKHPAFKSIQDRPANNEIETKRTL